MSKWKTVFDCYPDANTIYVVDGMPFLEAAQAEGHAKRTGSKVETVQRETAKTPPKGDEAGKSANTPPEGDEAGKSAQTPPEGDEGGKSANTAPEGDKAKKGSGKKAK